uniref:Calciumdependent protein 1 putative n=1 Tax=Albugo laibachii Nc14 TaxID=890382 RepID=F0W2P4_9STRA|nr:calciumdependent protein 1 putative [Albugo laibachii Nc14]|eukprot:CCA15330.1 calciumdependent protein 1 putative [Albugo laibachii Nc14]
MSQCAIRYKMLPASKMKLYSYPGNYRVFKILIAAEYNGVDIEVPEFDMTTIKSKEFLAKNPLGKVPVLETENGSLFESNAIARYVARLRADSGLSGRTFFESGQVDSWMDFSAHELEVPLQMWLYPVFGYMKFNAGTKAKAMEDVKKALQVLENHLHLRTYLVGEQITLADIVIASLLVYPMKMLMDKEFRKPYSAVNRWFNTLVNQPEFQKVIGDVPLCDVPVLAEGDNGGKKETKKNAPKATNAPKETVEEAPKPKKKVEHPLVVLNREKPSKMVLDEWKVQYSNTKPVSDSMKWFWDNFDSEGYSIWMCDYNYNEENKVLFMTSNAVNGFIQRSEGVRKFAFGVMHICGEEGSKLDITGCWLFRGDTVEHIMEANPDAEYYTWKRVTTFDDASKARIAAYWCNDAELEGRPLADSRVFK